MKMKNNGPCSIKNCTYTNTKFRLITKLAYEKCYEKQMLQIFSYLEVGKQLCHPHYCNIVEVDRGQRRRNKKEKNTQKRKPLEPIELISNNTNTDLFSSNIHTLTKVLYQLHRRDCVDLELDPAKFKNMIESACPQLNGFFNYLLAYEKCYEKQMLQIFSYLEVGKQLCHPHYCNIVEVDRGQRRRNKKEKNTQKRKPLEPIELISNNTNTDLFSSNIHTLTKVLYQLHRRDCVDLELDPAKFKNMIESACPQLNGFFNYLVNTIIPKECSAYNKNEAKKSIVGLCATWEAIDTISSLGYSACAKTIEEYRKKIQKEHIINIENYFIKNKNIFYIYNIDDYHSIHENRRPNTVSTSTAKHFVTCVAKPITNCSSLPLMFNEMSIHNPANVEASRICWYLIHQYIEHLPSINQFDRIELLTIHNYNDNIKERKIERSMKDLQLLGFNEQNLHSMQDYLNALKIIISINNKTQHLNGQIAPVVADWPDQIFIRKALYTQLPLEFQPFYLQIKSFIPIMGPLHLSLNSREQVVLVHHSFFEKLFHFVFEFSICGWIKIKDQIIKKFGKTCKDIEYQITIDLLENLIPSTLDIYAILFRAGLFEKYIETVFRIWTFALRWKRKNYNKAPLIFLSDIFYWKENHPLFYNLLQNQLPSFNDYYVENTHSKIRANTSANATVENIIKQAYVITNHNPMFKDTYCKTRHYPYNIPMLNFLSNKTRKSKPKLNKRTKYPKTYILATLGEEVDLRRLPTGYSTSFLPQNGLCDCCKLPINETNGTTFICGHGYHLNCYNGKCKYCEEFYKKGIFENVDSFLKRIEKGSDVFTQEDLDNENNTEEEEEQYDSVEEIQDISHKLEIEINNIKNCTSFLPQNGLCDCCKLPINETNGTTFICGHGYHLNCYNGKCKYCEEFYKKGIFENVDSFLKRIEKGSDVFTQEDLDNENNTEEEEEQYDSVEEIQDISHKLEIEINNIKNW
ncbi:hypothetical protein Glove_71g82 [Diversispora epigaea]|uniref:Uncharacterized protein n=1 Tax=Diversispora epigaea TaxID=1348612 RepID=A0A397JJJ7_9GLOM|nr:hypothetical protein Glove_71g82 [Diversispora epigaea]